jgi:hypothetical protein
MSVSFPYLLAFFDIFLVLVGEFFFYVCVTLMKQTRAKMAVAHSIVLFYQVVTLNVAINSHSNALLTLLLSNQFVEIKGSVFKKFERENLFQLSCSGEFVPLHVCI